MATCLKSPLLVTLLLLSSTVLTIAYETKNPPPHSKCPNKCRRSFICGALATCSSASFVGSIFGLPTAATAKSSDGNIEVGQFFPNPPPIFIGDGPMIQSFPDVKYLIPLYDLNSAILFLEKQLTPQTEEDATKGIQRASKALQYFFGGGLLSNKNVFRGLCIVYVQEIKYDDPDRDHVQRDKLDRILDCDATLDAMSKLNDRLKKMVKDGNTAVLPPGVLDLVQEAKKGLKSFLDKVPKEDVERVVSWLQTIKDADIDKSGKLEESEIAALSEADQLLYKDVGELVGVSY